ncbi:MAG: chromosome segregation protein SMC [Longimicrobiales bacterium]|nr:chromosome segregation protein SMC [Longimicrobiales bacterium]
MKLQALRVHGFKSFADATEVKFHDGVTAIVGPNGCGKSNISDAIRWVLGEQRPTAIRGAKMEEAIFQGSVHRRPVNRGSVTITVTNEDQALPVPFEEVEVGRTVFRDGGSDYSINRSSVRLRDVVDLTRDTGLGGGANVIENRMIDAILSDRADERRGLFEEAAGIGRYKDRRKAALRRLERAEMDLQRLEDVISEVETKVRSLARQKGKAERYIEYRGRRLSVEVAVVRHQLDTLGTRLTELDRALAGDLSEGEGKVAEVQAAEAESETLRLRQAEAQRERARAAEKLDEVRTGLVTWERDLAVAEERSAYARRRLDQIAEERATAREQATEVASDRETLTADRETIASERTGVTEELEARRAEAGEVRRRLQEARAALEETEVREREIARRGAQLEGDAEAAEAQVAELARRIERLAAELDETSSALSDLEEQGDLFSGRLDVLRAEGEAATGRVDEAEAAVEVARRELDAAREEESVASARAQRLQSQREALEGMERDREGIAPVIAAVSEAGIEGVHAPLIDFISAAPEFARAVESYLGSRAQGLVVADAAAAGRVHRWFREQWEGGGGLVILPADAAPKTNGTGSLLHAIEPSGAGAGWVTALLDGVDLVEEEALLEGDGARVARTGSARDVSGVIRIGNPSGVTGVLERKERLKQLGIEAEEAGREADASRATLEAARAHLREVESRQEEARAARRAAEDTFREAQAEVAAAADRHERMDRHRDEVARQLEGARAAQMRAAERAEEAREDRTALAAEEAGLGEARREARTALERVQGEWEAARGEESRLEVQDTRLRGEVERLDERLAALERTAASLQARTDALDAEETGLRAELESAAEVQREGKEATHELFDRQDAAQAELRRREAALEEVAESLADAEQRARSARQAEREVTDRRHRLELERQELTGRIGRIQDRIEGEWGKPLERLLEEAEAVEGSPDELEEELREIVVRLEKIGPVNMLAVEEHAEESQRLDFLSEQRDDLVQARNDLRSAIREINETATTLFTETFENVREHFQTVHQRLFEGGEADIWLEDPSDPLESPVEIHASPQGKKTQRIDLLSGGERALTALSLLFAIYLVKPSPFCVLDEVDAPLDENNIGRFIRLLHDFKDHTQFVVITHNPRTIEAADWIYGVTMEEPGVSKIVGVHLEDALEQAKGAA